MPWLARHAQPMLGRPQWLECFRHLRCRRIHRPVRRMGTPRRHRCVGMAGKVLERRPIDATGRGDRDVGVPVAVEHQRLAVLVGDNAGPLANPCWHWSARSNRSTRTGNYLLACNPRRWRESARWRGMFWGSNRFIMLASTIRSTAHLSGHSVGKAASFAFGRKAACGSDLRCYGKAGSFAYGGPRP